MKKIMLSIMLALVLIAPAVFSFSLGVVHNLDLTVGDVKNITFYITNPEHKDQDAIIDVTGPLAEFMTYDSEIHMAKDDEIKQITITINFTKPVLSNEPTNIMLREKDGLDDMISAMAYAASYLPINYFEKDNQSNITEKAVENATEQNSPNQITGSTSEKTIITVQDIVIGLIAALLIILMTVNIVQFLKLFKVDIKIEEKREEDNENQGLNE